MYKGAWGPSILQVLIFALYTFALGLVKPHHVPGVPRSARTLDGWALWGKCLRGIIPSAVLIFAVLGSMGGLPFMDTAVATPTEAGAMGCVGALVLAAIHRRLTADLIWQAMDGTMRITAMVVFILIGSRVFSLVFQGVDGAKWIEHMLSGLPGGQIGFLIVVNIFIFFLAFFLDFFEIAFIILPMLGPVADKMGIDLVWFGVLLCVNMQTSFMHPPFGFALFYLRGISDTLFQERRVAEEGGVERHLHGRHSVGGDAADPGRRGDLRARDGHGLPREGKGGRPGQGLGSAARHGRRSRSEQSGGWPRGCQRRLQPGVVGRGGPDGCLQARGRTGRRRQEVAAAPGAQPMLTAISVIFVVAYIAIAMEHPLGINKSASASSARACCGRFTPAGDDVHRVSEQLGETLTGTAQIVFFLIGAMTIVEVVDAHNGFEVITARIKTAGLASLMGLVGIVTFFLSAILDNLTTTIVMVSLTRKLLHRHEDRLFFAGIIVIAANAGGAWTPIGDVTTTMLWIGGQITSLSIMKALFLPSLVSLAGAARGDRLPAARQARDQPAARCGRAGHPDLADRAQPDVLPGAGHPGGRAGLQECHPSAALHGHPLRARPAVAGRRPGAPAQAGGRQAPPHAGSMR
jgi:TRAP-type mannitol/chloroaromatic compound transport system permease large subunit